MGYTHYWKIRNAFTDETWNAFVNDVKQVFNTTDIPIANGHGEEGTTPIIDESKIIFNGVGDDSHESCFVTKSSCNFEFCKTSYKPYDKVVVKVLKLAREHNPSIELSSDGGYRVFG